MEIDPIADPDGTKLYVNNYHNCNVTALIFVRNYTRYGGLNMFFIIFIQCNGEHI